MMEMGGGGEGKNKGDKVGTKHIQQSTRAGGSDVRQGGGVAQMGGMTTVNNAKVAGCP